MTPATAPRIDPDLLAAAKSRTMRGAAALARLVTRLETNPHLAATLPEPTTTGTWVLGVTGPPGVGKSSLVADLTTSWRATGATVAVIAVDPTSPASGGAFLGDRVRLREHSTDPGVFIRSLATRGALGGLSTATAAVLDGVLLCGFDVVVVETVGVGQSELDIAGLADTTLVLLAPGMGDTMQAAKAGLMEVADIFSVHQADRPESATTQAQVRSAMALAGRDDIPVVTSSLRADDGLEDLVTQLATARNQHVTFVKSHGKNVFGTQRLLREATAELLWRDAMGSTTVRAVMDQVNRGEISLWKAAAIAREVILSDNS